jgi:hypothetical protein
MKSRARIERRLRKKAKEKERNKIVKDMNALQRFIYEGLNNGEITKEQVSEIAVHFVEKELLATISETVAEEFLKSRGYIVTKDEEEKD